MGLRGTNVGTGVAVAFIALAAAGCGSGGGKPSGSIARCRLTTVGAVSGLESVRLTAGTAAKTYALESLSPTPAAFDLTLPAGFVGSIEVDAVARPAVGCMGYGGTGTALIANVGDVVTVNISMTPQDICQVTGTAGTGGTTGMGGTSGAAGTGGGAGGSSAGSGGASGSGGTGATAGTGGASGGRGGSGGAAGTGGASGVAGRGGSGGAGGQPSCGAAVGGRPALVPPPSLSQCTEYSQNDPGAACSTSNNANNPWINDVAVSPDGQYMATAGSHQASQPTPTDEANDRVRIWRLAGSVPTPCGSIDISNPGAGPAYVAFSPNGQYLAVAWRGDYVYVYSVPSFTMVGSILSSYYPLYGVGFSPDSQTVFSIEYDRNYDDGTLFADRPTGEAIAIGQLGVDPDVLAVSPVASGGNTATIAVGGYNGNTAVYTFNGTTISAPTVVNTGPAAAAWAVRFNPAGDLLAVGTDEGIVRFWSIPLVSAVPTGSSITAKALSLVSALAFSPQGTHIAIGFDQETDIFNVATRAFVARASASDIVDAVTFSASGAALISGENSCGRVLLCAD